MDIICNNTTYRFKKVDKTELNLRINGASQTFFYDDKEKEYIGLDLTLKGYFKNYKIYEKNNNEITLNNLIGKLTLM